MLAAACVALSPFIGCAMAKVRAEAAATLKCPEAAIQIEERQHNDWVVNGCGRMGVCSLGDSPGAEVSCAGGGEVKPIP